MSRTPSTYNLKVVRATSWYDYFDYVDPAGVPIDLSSYGARLQVRSEAGQYGTSTTDTLVLELSTADNTLQIVTPPNGTVANRVLIPELTRAALVALNPANEDRVDYPYGLEVFSPDVATPDIVIPLVHGRIAVPGWEVR